MRWVIISRGGVRREGDTSRSASARDLRLDGQRGTRGRSAGYRSAVREVQGRHDPASVADPEWLNMPPEERAQTSRPRLSGSGSSSSSPGPAINFLLAMSSLRAFSPRSANPARRPSSAESNVVRAPIRPASVLGRFVSVHGRHVERFEEIQDLVRIRPDEPLRSSSFATGGR